MAKPTYQQILSRSVQTISGTDAADLLSAHGFEEITRGRIVIWQHPDGQIINFDVRRTDKIHHPLLRNIAEACRAADNPTRDAQPVPQWIREAAGEDFTAVNHRNNITIA